MEEPAWKKIGYTLSFCAEALKHIRDCIANTDLEFPLDSRCTGTSARLFRITDPTKIAVLKHLGVTLPDEGLADWEPLTRETPKLSGQFFYGNWRDEFVNWEDDGNLPDPTKPWLKSGPLTVAECRDQLGWIDILRHGLFWALFFDDAEQLAKLVAWPDTDLREDEGLDDLTKADCDYYVMLCKWLRGKPFDPDGPLTASIHSGTKKRPKLLLVTLRAIVRGDGPAYGKAMLDHLKHYQKSGFHTRSIRRCVSLDGSILWQVARRRGLPQPALPEALEHLVLSHATLPVRGGE